MWSTFQKLGLNMNGLIVPVIDIGKEIILFLPQSF
jgi:hypothetical protein